MNEKRYILYGICLCLILCIENLSAQTGREKDLQSGLRYATCKERDNWFVSAGAGIQSFLVGKDKTTGIEGITPLFDVRAGRWLTRISALRAGVGGGYFRDEYETYPTLNFYMDYQADLLSLFKYKEYRAFDLYASLGMGYDYVASRPVDPVAEMLSLRAGIQLGWNVSRKVSIYIEPSVKLTSDLLDGDINATKRWIGGGSAGVTYRFGIGRYRAYVPEQYMPEDVERLTDEVNTLRREMEQRGGVAPASDLVSLSDSSVCSGKSYYTGCFGDNIYIQAGGSAGLVLAQDVTPADVFPGASLAVGKWFSPFWGAQVNAVYGQVDDYRLKYWGVGGEFLFDLSSAVAGVNEKRLFSVIPLVGLGWMKANQDGAGNNSFAVTAGIQGRFNVSSHVDIFAEGRGRMFADHFFRNGAMDCSHGMVSLQLGITYKLNGRRFKTHDFSMVNQINRLNAKINDLRRNMDSAEVNSGKRQDNKKEGIPENLLDRTEDGKLFVRVKFDSFSSFLDKAQLQHIDNIGGWLEREKHVKIMIIPFSDDSANEKLDEILRLRRANAIMEILIGKYGINENRIDIQSPEKAGYKDDAGSDTIILFIQE